MNSRVPSATCGENFKTKFMRVFKTIPQIFLPVTHTPGCHLATTTPTLFFKRKRPSTIFPIFLDWHNSYLSFRWEILGTRTVCGTHTLSITLHHKVGYQTKHSYYQTGIATMQRFCLNQRRNIAFITKTKGMGWKREKVTEAAVFWTLRRTF